jgi:hypothetical protein
VSGTQGILAASTDLETVWVAWVAWGAGIAVREVGIHWIEEYACGHADLLRERVDGWVGQ